MGTPVILDSASPLYAYLDGQGVLHPYQQGTDDVSHAAISNKGRVPAGHAEGKREARQLGWRAFRL